MPGKDALVSRPLYRWLAPDGTAAKPPPHSPTNAMSVLNQRESDTKEEAEKMIESWPMTMGDPVATLAAGSVLYSWYNFYVKGNKMDGIFVGLWAPTLLAAASYLQQKNVVQKFKRGLSSF